MKRIRTGTIMTTAAPEKLKPEFVNPVFTSSDLGSTNSVFSVLLFSLSDFFEWWYIQMPILYILHFRRVGIVLNDQLSISLLLRTFFIPWHRDYKPVGFFMGITMRAIYLPLAGFIYLLAMLAYTLAILLWIFLPMLTLIFIVLTPFIK